MRRSHHFSRGLYGLAAMLIVFAPAVPRAGSEDSRESRQRIATASILTPTFDKGLARRGDRMSARSGGELRATSSQPFAAPSYCSLPLPGSCLEWRISLSIPVGTFRDFERSPQPRAPPASLLL